MEPIELLRAIFGRWRTIAAAFVIAGIAGMATASSTPPPPTTREYEATTILVVAPAEPGAFPSINLETVALYVTSNLVAERAAEVIGFRGPANQLAGQIAVETDKEAGSLSIIARAFDERRAEQLSNTFARELLGYLEDRNKKDADEQLEDLAQKLQIVERQLRKAEQRASGGGGRADAEYDARLRQYSLAYEQYQEAITAGVPGAGLELLQEGRAVGTVSRFSAPRSRAARAAIAAFLGLLLGLGLALVLERFDARVRSKHDAEVAFGLPVLAEIPHVRHRRGRRAVPVVTHPLSRASAAFRMLGSEIAAADTVRQAESPSTNASILVTSPSPAEGKTTVVANLAAVFSQAGSSVVAVSADFRSPTLHEVLEVPAAPGLIQAIQSGGAIGPVLHDTAVRGLSAVPSGGTAANPAELLGHPSTTRALTALRATSHVTVIDTPPMLDAADAATLLPQVSSVLVVARIGTSRAAARRTGEFLRRSNASIAGVVMVGARRSLRESIALMRGGRRKRKAQGAVVAVEASAEPIEKVAEPPFEIVLEEAEQRSEAERPDLRDGNGKGQTDDVDAVLERFVAGRRPRKERPRS